MSELPPSASSAPGVSYVEIGEDRAGQRLDNFLIVHLKGVPKSRIYRIIRDGQVRVNKKRAKQTTRLEAGDEVRIPPVRTSEESVAPSVGQGLADRLARSLIYEDKYLLVYNKPAGLAVHGGSGISLGLIETLRALRPEEKSLELVHRLDRDTSGLIMVARHRPFLRRLQKMMQLGQVEKRYWLLCQGFKGQDRRVEAPLLKLQQGNERVVRVSRDGKSSLTDFKLLERLNGFQLVEATLGTGRTHQIRVHAQYSGFPLLGDSKYGVVSVNEQVAALGVNRLCLHARTLVLKHPETGELLRLEAPLDEAFDGAITRLRGKALKGIKPASADSRAPDAEFNAAPREERPQKPVRTRTANKTAGKKEPVAKKAMPTEKAAARAQKATEKRSLGDDSSRPSNDRATKPRTATSRPTQSRPTKSGPTKPRSTKPRAVKSRSGNSRPGATRNKGAKR